MDDATTHNEYELSPERTGTAGSLAERVAVSTLSRVGVRPGVPSSKRHLGRVAVRAPSGAEDPLGALETLTGLRGKIELQIDENAVRALRAGCSYSDVARALGVSRQAAHRRYRDTASPRVVATAEARRLLRAAREEAVRAKAPALGSEHLLVAALRCGGDTAEALTDAGVTLDHARLYAREVASGLARNPRPESSGVGVRGVLRDAAGAVAARRGRCLDANTLLLAALSDPEAGACRVLSALAVDPGSIQRRLRGDLEASRQPCPRTDRDAE